MLDTAKRKAMLRQMVLVRAFEEKLDELYQRKAMYGSTHSYRGQEAIAVGVCAALEPKDLIASYHRGTGHLVAKGAELYTLLCECMGREDGYSKGRGGKMHMGDMGFGFIGNTGTVGGTVPTATGAALAVKIRGSNEVVVKLFRRWRRQSGRGARVDESRGSLEVAGDLRLREQSVRDDGELEKKRCNRAFERTRPSLWL